MENIENYALIAMALFGLAQAVARATPTKKDDEIVSKAGKFLNFLFSKTNVKKS